MPARRPNWSSFQADGLLAEVAPLKSILQVKIGNGITIVAHCLGTFVALVWNHSGSGMNLSPHQDLSRRRVEEKSQNLKDEENFRRASSELSLK
ncbi:protein serrate-like [Culex pipiens pallens]|nr:protein serrate-like [Culex pipiens pallens]